MHRILGIIRGGAGRVGLVAVVMTATVVALALPAGANTGHVHASQSCDGWWAKVTLDNNVTRDHLVEVTTTIPGTSGLVDRQYDTTHNSGATVIWSESGDEPTHGTVTLTILKPDGKFDTGDSATLHKVKHCNDGYGETTTTESTTTTSSTTTTTSTTTTATTMPPSIPGPTSSTTSTSAATTTSIAVGDQGSTTSTSPSSTTSTTEPQVSSTTYRTQGTPDHSTTSIETFPITDQLPFTGGSLFPAIFGGACLLGGALLALRHRRTIWTLRK